jgi:cell filamentation protein
VSSFFNDPHSERGFPCPHNHFGISDYNRLQPIEAPLVAKRGGELEDQGITGDFTPSHLRAIHRYLFQDVFPWAGELRVVNISKGNQPFGPAQFIAAALEDALAKLRREDLLINLTRQAFAARAAFYLGEINAIHPFREGNGRAQREFIRQLALHAGHPLSWSAVGTGFTQQQMIDASIVSHTKGDNTALAAIIEAALFSTRERINKESRAEEK